MLFALTLLSFSAHADTSVRATLGDGQILMGQVRTKTLRLATGAGVLDVPIEDIGEVVPVLGDQLLAAEGKVDVWLRNGSELHGTWSEPRLAMSIAVGGAKVGVDLPMNDLTRFQLQGGERWPNAPVYRMRTTWGDDFLVDPARTRLVLENHLGTFEPKLTECRFVAPIGDPEGEWRIELHTGTVLVGHLKDDAVTVGLPMGPEEMRVPLNAFVSLRQESWGYVQPARAAVQTTGEVLAAESIAPMRTLATAAPGGRAAAAGGRAAAPQTERTDDAWFDRAALDATKDAQGE